MVLQKINFFYYNINEIYKISVLKIYCKDKNTLRQYIDARSYVFFLCFLNLINCFVFLNLKEYSEHKIY